jgi:hypothetical protein
MEGVVQAMKNRNQTFAALAGIERSGGSTTPRYVTELVRNETLQLGDRGHYGYPDFPPNRDIGGPFILKGVTNTFGATAEGEFWPVIGSNTLGQHYNGHFHAHLLNGGHGFPTTTVVNTEMATAESWMPIAWDKMKPTKPVFNGLNAAYELHELPSMLRQRFLNSGLSSIGSYYLALKFGWEPLLKDIRNLIQTQDKAQKRLEWLLSHNGQPVRRRVKLRDDTFNESIVSGSNYGAFQPVLITQYYNGQPRYEQKTWSSRQVWATGTFKFWLPPGPRSVAYRRRMLAELYGLNPSPQVIYKMVPWSWLVDWFFNVGPLLGTLDTGVADRLAASNFYMMSSFEGHRTVSVTGRMFTRGGGGFDLSATAYSNSYVKLRAKGNAFRPGTNPATLNGTQLSILGALGLSKMGSTW